MTLLRLLGPTTQAVAIAPQPDKAISNDAKVKVSTSDTREDPEAEGTHGNLRGRRVRRPKVYTFPLEAEIVEILRVTIPCIPTPRSVPERGVQLGLQSLYSYSAIPNRGTKGGQKFSFLVIHLRDTCVHLVLPDIGFGLLRARIALPFPLLRVVPLQRKNRRKSGKQINTLVQTLDLTRLQSTE
jgi:hypothetical protein